METIRFLAVAVLMIVSAPALYILQQSKAQAQAPGISRNELQRHDLSIPGRNAVQVVVGFEPGVVAPRHGHPGEEIVYEVEGSLQYRLDGKPPVMLKAGQVLLIPTGTIHQVRNVGGGHAAELATDIVEKSKPLLVLAK